MIAEPDSPAPASHTESRGVMARNAFHLVLGQAASTALAVVLSAALARHLGASAFGVFFVATSMATFAYVVVEWGQTQYVIREVARQPERSGLLLGSALSLRVVAGVLAAGVTALAAWMEGNPRETCQAAGVLVLGMLPFSLAQTYGLIFRGREHMGRDAFVSVLNKALVLGATLALLLLGAGLMGAVVAPALAGVGALAAAVVLLRGLHPPQLRTSLAGMRELLHGGAPLLLFAVLVAAQGYVDAVVLSKLAPGEAVGWYGAARSVFGTLLAPATILGSAAYPRLSRAAGDPALFSAEVRTAMRPLLGFAVLAGVGTHLFAGPAVGLIYGGDKYAPAATVLQVFAPGLFLTFVDSLLGGAVIAAGRSRALAMFKLVNVALTTVLDIVLVPIFQARYGNGGMAIALAFGGSEVVMFTGMLLLLPRGTLGTALRADVAKALVAGAGTLLVFWILPQLSLMTGSILCVMVFASFAVVLGLVRLDEIAELIRHLRSAPERVPGSEAIS